jgi:hypothetical protein
MKHNNDFKYDLEVGQVAENWLAEILQGKKIEVKRDLQAHKTGNIFVEYESRNKPSGLATSQADYYCYFLSDEHFVIIESDRFKKICRSFINTKRDIRGGDSNTSKGILLPINCLL